MIDPDPNCKVCREPRSAHPTNTCTVYRSSGRGDDRVMFSPQDCPEGREFLAKLRNIAKKEATLRPLCCARQIQATNRYPAVMPNRYKGYLFKLPEGKRRGALYGDDVCRKPAASSGIAELSRTNRPIYAGLCTDFRAGTNEVLARPVEAQSGAGCGIT